MKLFEVIYWGSPAGKGDTIYLVRAEDFKSAVDEVALNSSPKQRSCKERVPHVVYEIGEELAISPVDHPLILRGPTYEPAYNRGWRAWHRQISGSEYTDVWLEE